MVGIHARTGREKIFSQQIAHVLNDETQRKFIQGLKRIMTVCQRLYPADPSKSLEYNAVKPIWWQIDVRPCVSIPNPKERLSLPTWWQSEKARDR